MPNKTKKGPKKSKKTKSVKKEKEEKRSKDEVFPEIEEVPTFTDEIDELNYELGKAQEKITPGV